MNLASQIEAVQPDVYYKLLSEPWFSTISIYTVREHRLLDQVQKTLAGLGGMAGKLAGATIEVLMPTLKNALPDTAGPVCVLEQKFLVREQPTINLGAGGTGLTAEQIAVNIAQTFQLYFMGTSNGLQGFYTAPTFYKYNDMGPGSPFLEIEVTLNATFALSPVTRTFPPHVAAPGDTFTLTDEQPGGGSALYYTTDGSFPGPANAAATLYVAPFTLGSGLTVRVAAWNGALSGSMVQTYQT